jgi:hypothetical protein
MQRIAAPRRSERPAVAAGRPSTDRPPWRRVGRVSFTRRRTRSIFSAVLPLLALVWAALPLHHCNLAFAAADGGSTVTAGATITGVAGTPADAAGAAAHCGHQVADATQPVPSRMSCSDLGSAVPDLRPTTGIDATLVHVRFDAGWLERGLHPVQPSARQRPLDDGRWRQRPLHLQKSALLI